MENAQIPPNIRLLRLEMGFANSGVIYALAKTGVIEQLGNGAKTLDQLATSCMLVSDVLFRVLRYAAALELVSVDDERYSLTDMGRYLLKDVPGSLYGGILLMGSELWQKSWCHLASSLENGESAFKNTMGVSFFDYLTEDADHSALFNSWMTANSGNASRLITESYDFSSFSTVCDIAGGQGLLLKCILTANPSVKGILFDMEQVVQHHMLQDFDSRVSIQTGDFFKSIPVADLYMMKHIIHDWNDEKASRILQNCRKVMDAKSRLLIIERIVESEKDLGSLFMDLHMQVMAGGRERTTDEYEILLNKSGLKLNRIIPTPSPLSIIEATI